MPVTLPFNPGQVEFQGGMVGVGGLQGLISALGVNAAPLNGSWQYNSIVNAAGVTLSVPQTLGGILVRSGAVTVSDTLPTAALIAAGWPGMALAQQSLLVVANINTGTLTIVTAAGITLAGVTTIPAASVRFYSMIVTAAAVNIIGLSYANGVVTLTTNAPHGLAAGGNAIVANLSNAGFTGTFVIATIPNAYQLTYALTVAVAFGGATPNANIPLASAQAPGLLNTAPTMTFQGAFAWPTTAAVTV